MCCTPKRHHGFMGGGCCCPPRRFFLKEEEIKRLENYREGLKKEILGVERKIEEMKK